MWVVALCGRIYHVQREYPGPCLPSKHTVGGRTVNYGEKNDGADWGEIFEREESK